MTVSDLSEAGRIITVLLAAGNPNTFPCSGSTCTATLFFSACMIVFSLLGSALAITG
jgi:hypothetical protein